jgi:ribosomal protein L11 methyltransferase
MREYFTEQELRIDTAEVLDDDWAARSQADLRAVRVGRLIVAPPWDVPTALEPGDRLIVIKPSMGFGTGHHATTRLCLDLLQQIDCRGRQVLDIGTGSGVLAIAAGVLGARHVTAIDVDPDAIANARENIRENRTSGRIGDGVCALVDDLHHPLTHPPADIVLANLTGATLTASARQIVDRVAPGGWLVLSGVLEEEIADVVYAFEGLAVCKRVVAEAEWRAGVFHRFQRYSSPQA